MRTIRTARLAAAVKPACEYMQREVYGRNVKIVHRSGRCFCFSVAESVDRTAKLFKEMPSYYKKAS